MNHIEAIAESGDQPSGALASGSHGIYDIQDEFFWGNLHRTHEEAAGELEKMAQLRGKNAPDPDDFPAMSRTIAREARMRFRAGNEVRFVPFGEEYSYYGKALIHGIDDALKTEVWWNQP